MIRLLVGVAKKVAMVVTVAMVATAVVAEVGPEVPAMLSMLLGLRPHLLTFRRATRQQLVPLVALGWEGQVACPPPQMVVLVSMGLRAHRTGSG